MVNLNDKIKWVWDRCFDIYDNYDPKMGLSELKLLVIKRRIARNRRRVIYFSIASASVLLILIGVFSKSFINKYRENKEVNTHILNFAKNDFVIRIGTRIFINDFIKSKMVIRNGSIIMESIEDKEIISTNGIEDVQIFVPKGMRYSITLEDGSRIWACSNSILSFPSMFSNTERKISASGYLFFQINKAKSPFIVDLNNKVSVIVYGTVFSIEAYSFANELKTHLTEGRVSVKIGETEHLLLPNQTLFYNLETKTVLTGEMESSESIYWKGSSIYFNTVSLERLAKEVSKWFNVSVQFRDDLIKEITFTGNIPDNLDLNEIAEVLNATKQFKVVFDKNGLCFYKY